MNLSLCISSLYIIVPYESMESSSKLFKLIEIISDLEYAEIIIKELDGASTSILYSQSVQKNRLEFLYIDTLLPDSQEGEAFKS